MKKDNWDDAYYDLLCWQRKYILERFVIPIAQKLGWKEDEIKAEQKCGSHGTEYWLITYKKDNAFRFFFGEDLFEIILNGRCIPVATASEAVWRILLGK